MTSVKPPPSQLPIPGHPLAPDLFCCLFGEEHGARTIDLVSGLYATAQAGVTINPLVKQGMQGVAANQSYFQLAMRSFHNPPTITLVCRARIDAAGADGTSAILICRNFDGGSVGWMLAPSGDGGANYGGISWFGGGWGKSGMTTAVVGDGKWHTFVGTWDGTTAKYYIDGRLDASATPGIAMPITNSQPIDFNTYRNGGQYTTSFIDFAFGYRRALRDAEVRHISSDPFAAWPAANRRYKA